MGKEKKELETDLELLHLFRRCSHLMRRCTNSFPGQSYLLVLLRQNGPMTQRRLTELTQRRPATLSEQLENMERAGFVERKTSESDRRNIDLALTPAGEKAAARAAEERSAAAAELFGPLENGEKQELRRMLERLLALWDEGAEKRGEAAK